MIKLPTPSPPFLGTNEKRGQISSRGAALCQPSGAESFSAETSAAHHAPSAISRAKTFRFITALEFRAYPNSLQETHQLTFPTRAKGETFAQSLQIPDCRAHELC